MAIRAFSSSTADRIVLGSTGAELVNGGYSVVAVVKPVADGAALIGLRTGGSLVGSLADPGSARLSLDTASTSVRATAGMTTGDWQILAFSKPAGLSVVTFHRSVVGSGTWTHAASTDTQDDLAGTIDEVILGAYAPNGGSQDMRAAVFALFPEALANADVEAIGTVLTSQFLYDLGAVNLWNLNQASTATAVTDLIADSDQTTLIGTTVVTGDDPAGWNFTVSIPPPLDFSLRLSGGSSNTSPGASIGGAESAVEVGAGLFDAVSNPERTSGLVDYRLVYVHNDDVADGSVVAYIQTQLESGREIAIGAPTQAAGATVTAIANDQTAPASVTFSAPTTSGTGVSLGTIPAGSFRGLWLRRTVNSGTAVDPTNFAKVRLQVQRTS